MKTILLVMILLIASIHFAEAQQPKPRRIGVITSGGLWYETIDGLRVGLRQLGLEEGKQFTLVVRDTKAIQGQRRRRQAIWSERKSI
jgi:hypothetical protein